MIFSASSCKKVLMKDEELTIVKSPYEGNQLRLDGYYYSVNEFTNDIGSSYFFYKDGTILHGGGWPYDDGFEGLESIFNSVNWQKEIRNNRLNWGLFIVDENEISFERWYPSSGGAAPVYLLTGEIINDSTFVITKSIRSKTGEEKERNETYHFKPFSPKPDSTNNFIN
jgi:hypothetical protein